MTWPHEVFQQLHLQVLQAGREADPIHACQLKHRLHGHRHGQRDSIHCCTGNIVRLHRGVTARQVRLRLRLPDADADTEEYDLQAAPQEVRVG